MNLSKLKLVDELCKLNQGLYLRSLKELEV